MTVAILIALWVPPQEDVRVRKWQGDVRLHRVKGVMPFCQQITDKENWTKLWGQAKGKDDKVPDVDFGKNRVVVVFESAVLELRHKKFESVQRVRGELVLTFRASKAKGIPVGAPNSRWHYLFVEMPRSDGTIRVKERFKDYRGDSGGESKEEVVANFPPIGK